MPPLPKTKQERFVQFIFQGKNATEAAVLAKYSVKTAYSAGGRLLKKVEVQKRLTELQERATEKSIASVIERKQILSEIARGKLSDYVRCVDGKSHITVGLDSLNSSALSEVVSEELKIGKGEDAPIAQITKLKLRDPTSAIAELNKMEKIYNESTQVNIDNRSINISVDFKSELTTRINRLAAREQTSRIDEGPQPTGSG